MRTTKNITIPAALNNVDGVYCERMSDSGFSVVSAGAPFRVRINNQGIQLVSSGDTVGLEKGPALGRVEFLSSNTSAVDLVIGPFSATSKMVRPGAITTYPAGFEGNVGANRPGGPAQFPGIDSRGRERQVIYITNIDGTNAIDVFLPGSVGQNPVAPNAYVGKVYAKSKEEFRTNATLWLSSTQNDVTARVLEVFAADVTQP